MPVGLRFPRGTMKPPPGALVNPDHPFARGMSFCIPLNDGGIYPLVETPGPTPFPGSILTQGAPVGTTLTWGRDAVFEATFWDSNRDGRCITTPTGGRGVGRVTGPVAALPGSPFYMTDRCTVAFIRRKLDTTPRGTPVFNYDAGAGSYIVIYAPSNDSTVYWYFGTTALTVSITGTITTDVEKWIFTEGPSGPTIWRNGVKLAFSATPRTRTNNFGVSGYIGNNAGMGIGDIQQFNFVQLNDTQWSDEECRWWSAEPYAHLYAPETIRRYFFLGGGGGDVDEFTIDGTVRDILQAWSISEQLNERGTMRFGVKSMDATYRPGLREEVDFTWSSRHYFAGHIHHTDESALGAIGYGVVPIQTLCGATDFNALPDRRQVAMTLTAGTLKSMLVGFVIEKLDIYGVTLDPAQVNGPTIADDLVFATGNLTDVLNKLSVITGYAWNISYDKVLSMFAPGTEAAPFNLVDGDSRVIGDVRVSPTTVEYGNHITVRYTKDADAAYVYFEMDNLPVDGATFTVAGATFTFKNTPVGDRDVQIQGSVNATLAEVETAIAALDEVSANQTSSTLVTVTAAEAGAAGNSINVSVEGEDDDFRWTAPGVPNASHFYNGQDPTLTGVAIAQDIPAQEGGDNLYEKTYTHPEVESQATADALAAGYLVQSLVQPREIRYRTRLHGIHPGQQQSIQVTGRNIGAGSPPGSACLITQVQISPEGSALYNYDITAVEGLIIVPSHQDGWRSMAGREVSGN